MGVAEAGGRLTGRAVADHDGHLSIGGGLYVAGDAGGGPRFTHVADYEGWVAAANAFGRPHAADLESVPKTTFTEPETGAVGITAEQGRERGPARSR